MFAATQEARYNGAIYRRFGFLLSRLLLYKQGRLDNLQQQLEEYESDPTANPKGLSAWQIRKVGEEYIPDRLDQLMKEVMVEVTQYCE
jgi:hypothetical protein